MNTRQKQVLRLRNVIQLANPDSKNLRSKSVPNPSAQINKLYEDNEELTMAIRNILEMKEGILLRNPQLWYIIELLLGSGARVSEVLDISPGDILLNGSIRIKGKKGSSDRIISAGTSYQYMIKCKNVPRYPFMDWDRFRVYREFKKLGIGMRFKGKSKESVTHFFRQAHSRLMQMGGIDDGLRSQELGHKGKGNIKYYSFDGRK